MAATYINFDKIIPVKVSNDYWDSKALIIGGKYPFKLIVGKKAK